MKKNRKLDIEKALSEVEKVMQKYDLSGVVVLHTPESTRSTVKIDPSWSCAKKEENRIKVRAKLEDFGGDKEARKKKIDDTVEMFRVLRDKFVEEIYPYHEVLERLTAALEELDLKPE